MTMIQRSFFLPESLYAQLQQLAIKKRKPIAHLVRQFVAEGITQVKKKDNPGLEFLRRISKYQFRSGVKDLAKNHDKYLWENYRRSR